MSKADPVECARTIIQGCLTREFYRMHLMSAQRGTVMTQCSFEHYRATFQSAERPIAIDASEAMIGWYWTPQRAFALFAGAIVSLVALGVFHALH